MLIVSPPKVEYDYNLAFWSLYNLACTEVCPMPTKYTPVIRYAPQMADLLMDCAFDDQLRGEGLRATGDKPGIIVRELTDADVQYRHANGWYAPRNSYIKSPLPDWVHSVIAVRDCYPVSNICTLIHELAHLVQYASIDHTSVPAYRCHNREFYEILVIATNRLFSKVDFSDMERTRHSLWQAADRFEVQPGNYYIRI